MKNYIKMYRAEKSLTQKELAQMTGVSRQAIIAIENEKHDPSLKLAGRIAKALEKPIDTIFDLDDID